MSSRPVMKLIEAKFLEEEEKFQVLEIWNAEYPATLSYPSLADFNSYLDGLSEPTHYLLKDENNCVLAWACKFIRDSEKWFAIILRKQIHGKGKGTEILNAIKSNETCLNGWVIDKETFVKLNGEMYRSPLDFYLKNSFRIFEETRLDNEKISSVKITWKINS